MGKKKKKQWSLVAEVKEYSGVQGLEVWIMSSLSHCLHMTVIITQ